MSADEFAAWERERHARIRAQARRRERTPRERVLDVLAPKGAPFEYGDADTCAVACPICAEWLRITFAGALVDLWCLAGCAEADIIAAAFGRAA